MFKNSGLHPDYFTHDPARHVSLPNLVLSGLALANPHVGQGVYSLRLIEGLLDKMGARLLVVAIPDIARPPSVPAENFLHLSSVRAPRTKMIRSAIFSDQLLRHVAHEFPEATFHSPGPIWGLTKPAKTVVTLHDCIYRHFPAYNGRFFLRRLLMQGTERFAAGASLILTDSEFSRRDLIAKTRIPECKIRVLYPWVGNEFLDPIITETVSAVRTRLQLPPKFWLYLGGYDYRKNVEFLLDAYAAAARRVDLPPLVLAGKIPEQGSRATCDVKGTMDRLKLTREQVFLPGPVQASDIAPLYRAADLLVYPSLMEGFGLPPAEAIAVGTPVLSSSAGSLPEVIINPDSLFDPQDLDALVEKLLAAADATIKFVCELSPQFEEEFGIKRYLKLIGSLGS